MKTFQLLEGLEFHDHHPSAEPLLVNETGRVLRFTLRPGQVVREHRAPDSPVYLIVLTGRGMFAGPDGKEREFGPNALLTFEPGEAHSVRALEDELVFVALLHEAPSTRSGVRSP